MKYVISDLKGEKIFGTFYEKELIHGVDTSKFAKKVDLASWKSNLDKLDIEKWKNVSTNLNNWKSKVDKLDVNKLVPVSVDLSKLSNVVKSDVVKKDVYNAKIKYLILLT